MNRKMGVLLISAIFLISCGKEEELKDRTVFYLPVWVECLDNFKNFYTENNIEHEFIFFPEHPYIHPRLLGTIKVTKPYDNGQALYPSVNCLADNRTTNEYSSPVALRVIENMMEKIQSDGKPDLAYMVFNKDSYSLYWSEREKGHP